jgi:hypothetical protein
LDQHKSRASISVKVSFELVEGKSIHDWGVELEPFFWLAAVLYMAEMGDSKG